MAHPGKHAAATPDAAAVIMASSGETITWKELHTRATGVANSLWDAGLRAGDGVAFSIENRPEFAVVMWACQYAGFRWTPISTRLSANEAAYIVANSGAKVLAYTTATAGILDAVDRSTLVRTIDLDGEPLSTLATDEARYERSEGRSMMYSSGTTGRPKGIWRAAPSAPVETLSPGDQLMAAVMGLDASSVYLQPAPLYHSAPITFLILAGRIGATTVVMERFDAQGALDAIGRYRVTHSQWVPTMFVRMLRLPETVRAAADLSTQRWAIHGAGPCSIATKQAMLDWWGPIIWEYYSGSEDAGTCIISPEEWLAHPGSVGRSVSGAIHILDDSGDELPAGEVGQVWFENRSNFRYLGDDIKTAEAQRDDGEGTFGDLGYVDDDGYLYLTDRKAFTINSGGVNIYPREVEQVLEAHPAVADVVVFGIPDEEWGEQVKAVVQPVDGADTDGLDTELITWCRERLAHLKVPRSIDFDPDLPREATGKLRVATVRDRYR